MTKLAVGEASLCSDHPQLSNSNIIKYWQQYIFIIILNIKYKIYSKIKEYSFL